VSKNYVKMPVVVFLLTIFMLLGIASPATGYLGHTVDYSMDGRVELQKQAGHEYETGARMRQVVTGQGEVSKQAVIEMEEGYLQVEDNQDWVTADDALRDLTITTNVRLFTPAKYVYGVEDAVVWWEDVYEALSPVYYEGNGDPDFSARRRSHRWDALTSQTWAVQVSANPGETGQLRSDFEAVYGPGAAEAGADTFLGDYFEIEQLAATSDGTLRRYIDISSSRRHAYLFEDMRVDGTATVNEAFSLINITGAGLNWYDLF